MPNPDTLARTLERLAQWRRRVAPPGSRREAATRLIYAPLVNALVPRRERLRLQEGPAMAAEIVYLGDINVAGFRATPVTRIVVFKLDHIGDLILGMRALRMLREGFPDAHITLVCGSWNQDWARRLHWFDRIVAFDFFSALNRDWTVTHEDLAAIHDRVSALPLDSYDLAVDLRHDADTRPCLWRVRATYRAGFHAPAEPGRPPLDLLLPLSEGVAVGDAPAHSLHAELRLQVLAAAVVAAFGPAAPHPARALVSAAPPVLGALPVLGAPQPAAPFAILAIGAGDPIRCWPIERYSELGQALITRHGLDIVVLGGAAEHEDAARLAALLPGRRVRIVVGRPLAELPQLVAGATLCVCNGSGMSHLAAALGVATIAVLGGTTRMEVWHPAGPNALSVGGRTACQPCGLKHAHECPWDVVCLTAVTTRHVLDACDRLLARTISVAA